MTSRARCNGEGRAAGSTLIALGLPGPLSNAVDVWSEYAESHVSHVAKAAGFVRFALSLDPESGRRIVEPRHYVIAFPLRDQGRQKHQSALFTLRVVREEEISRDPNAQGAVANHLRFKPPSERRLIPGADEYVEFELLSREHEVPSQQPLRISMGPVRADKQTGQKEFVRVDMGQCIQRIATDIIEDPRGGQRLVQNRWWMCIETLRLLCNVDQIDCTALDKAGVPPQEWVIRLMDTHAPINRKEELQERQEERDIDDLMDFIDSHGPGRGCGGRSGGGAAPQRPPRTRKKKGGREKDAEVAREPGAGGEAAPAPGPAAGPAADAADTDLMGELLCRYRRLQEASGRVEREAKVSVVRELLEVLDELEKADAEMEEDSLASRVIFSAARKFEAKLRSLGLVRVEALGKPFNGAFHRAVGDVPEAECMSQVVVEELESGWVLGEDIVRPALVTLG
mmetsp:Transcript_44493/g.138056  ORF Transcript_44493/g.138056 Transcript_44493/m.138056 type:complete len:455 (-) Transcript_44493:42-1406(-)